MYRWLMRFAAAGAGTVLLVMVIALGWHPVFCIFPLMLILLAFADCTDNSKERPVADDVRRVVIKPDNRRWDFGDEECCRTQEKTKNRRIHKIVM